MAGVDNKRPITIYTLACYVLLVVSFLHFKCLYEGKTERCHLSTAFPDGCDIWHSPQTTGLIN